MADSSAAKRVSLRRQSTNATAQLIKNRRASAILQAQDMAQAGVSHASEIELMSDDELRLVLDERGIPHSDVDTRIELLTRVNETSGHNKVASRKRQSIVHTLNNSSNDAGRTDVAQKQGRGRSSITELTEFDHLDNAACNKFRQDMAKVAAEVHKHQVSPEQIEFNLNWPEYKTAKEDYVERTQPFEAIVHLPVDLIVKPKTDKPKEKVVLVEEKAGWMFKKGRTSHAVTRDYKKRWFELSHEGQGDYLLTYFSAQPPSILGDDFVPGRKRSLSNSDVKDIQTRVSSKSISKKRGSSDDSTIPSRASGIRSFGRSSSSLRQRPGKGQVDERGALVKGVVDLSTVFELRKSKLPNLPNGFAFELVTPSRIWVLAPTSEQEYRAWLSVFCDIVKRKAVSPEIKELLHLEDEAEDQVVSKISVMCTPETTLAQLVQQTLSEHLRATSVPLANGEKAAADFILKVRGLRSYLIQQRGVVYRYWNVQESLSANQGVVEFTLVLLPHGPLVPPPKVRKRKDSHAKWRKISATTLGASRDNLLKFNKIVVADLKWRFRVRILGVENIFPKIKSATVQHGEEIVRDIPLELTDIKVEIRLVDSGHLLPGCEHMDTPLIPYPNSKEAYWVLPPWMMSELLVCEIPPAARIVFCLYGVTSDNLLEPELLASVALQLIDSQHRLVSGVQHLPMWHNLIDTRHGPCVAPPAEHTAGMLHVEFDQYLKEVESAEPAVAEEDEPSMNTKVERSGWLHKTGGSTLSKLRWQRRWFVLNQKKCQLAYYASNIDVRQGQPKGRIPLAGAQVESAHEMNQKKSGKGGTRKEQQTWCFKITPAPPHQSRKYLIYSETRQDEEEWMDAIAHVALHGADKMRSSSGAAYDSPGGSASGSNLYKGADRSPFEKSNNAVWMDDGKDHGSKGKSGHNHDDEDHGASHFCVRGHAASVSRHQWLSLLSLEDPTLEFSSIADLRAEGRFSRGMSAVLSPKIKGSRGLGAGAGVGGGADGGAAGGGPGIGLQGRNRTSTIASLTELAKHEMMQLIMCDPAALQHLLEFIETASFLTEGAAAGAGEGDSSSGGQGGAEAGSKTGAEAGAEAEVEAEALGPERVAELLFWLAAEGYKVAWQFEDTGVRQGSAAKIVDRFLVGGSTAAGEGSSRVVRVLRGSPAALRAAEQAKDAPANLFVPLQQALLPRLQRGVDAYLEAACFEDSGSATALSEIFRCSWLETRCMLHPDGAKALLSFRRRYPTVHTGYMSACLSELHFNEQVALEWINEWKGSHVIDTSPGGVALVGGRTPKQDVWAVPSLSLSDRLRADRVSPELEQVWFGVIARHVPGIDRGSMHPAERLLLQQAEDQSGGQGGQVGKAYKWGLMKRQSATSASAAMAAASARKSSVISLARLSGVDPASVHRGATGMGGMGGGMAMGAAPLDEYEGEDTDEDELEEAEAAGGDATQQHAGGATSTSRSSSAVTTPSGGRKGKRFSMISGSVRRSSDVTTERDFAKAFNRLQFLFNSDPLYKVTSMEKAELWKFRKHCHEYSKALPKFLVSVNWMSAYQVREAHRLLRNWQPPEKPTDALDLLDERFGDPSVRVFAVDCLRDLTDLQLARFLPQLTQALKYENHHGSPLALFLMERALASPNMIGLRLYWSLRVETNHPQFRERYGLFISEYLRQCGDHQRAVIIEQDKLFSQHGVFAKIALKLQNVKGGKAKQKEVLREELEAVNRELPSSFQLPLDPQIEVGKLRVEECKVMDSAKKPLWLVFNNAEPGGSKVLAMFKAGDDLRQDCVTLQILDIMDDMWRNEGLNLHILPYKCQATWHDGGMLQIVPDSDTTANIHKRYGGNLGAYKDSTFSDWIKDNNKENYEEAVDLFVHSCAGYCVATYVMGIGDRHNDNILISKAGRYFHIDFGHFLGNFKYGFGVKRERTAFVFTPEMAYAMGGKDGKPYAKFLDLACRAYNILRKNANTLIHLFTLMVPAGMPELASRDDINYMRDMLALDLVKESDAADRFRAEVAACLSNKMRRLDNTFHILKHAL